MLLPHGSALAPAIAQVTYEQALAAIFVEGYLFMILSVTRVRKKVYARVPRSIELATSCGIGLFLAFIGLQAQQGLGIATYSETTMVTLGVHFLHCTSSMPMSKNLLWREVSIIHVVSELSSNSQHKHRKHGGYVYKVQSKTEAGTPQRCQEDVVRSMCPK